MSLIVAREKKRDTRTKERAKEKRVLFLKNSLLSENFLSGCKDRFLQIGKLLSIRDDQLAPISLNNIRYSPYFIQIFVETFVEDGKNPLI
jgi:hypothetical protein